MSKKRLLIVDDDLAFSEMLSEILKDEGFTVSVEHDGTSGLARAFEEKPDLLMVDMMMPGMTGIAVLEKLRADEWGSTVPAILLTNVTQPEAMAATLENGPPTQYLLKTDWTLDQIAERIKKLLGEA